jgi:topoisomerase-4 subunit A
VPISEIEGASVVAITNEGRMLVFSLADLPQLARGKGNKIIGIPGARVLSREEFVVGVQVMAEKDVLVVHAGKRHINLKFSELEHYRGERGRRGNKLPRGFQKVDAMTVER